MPAVLYEKRGDGAVAVVTLNRPEVLNAYDVEMRDALYEALLAVRDDPEVRVVLLRGNGRVFCSGGDLREFGSAPSPVAARQTRWRRDVWGTLRSLPKLSIAAVHGLAVGGGFEMALLCDQCLASSDARFSLPETGLGMIPGVAGTQTLPRTIGLARAMRLVLSGTELSAFEALRWGIVNRVFPSKTFRRSALDQASRLARLSPRLVGALKQAVGRGLDLPLEDGLRLERDQLSACGCRLRDDRCASELLVEPRKEPQ
jgi:enoyl-CoA hydratase/carnithine racemase